MTKEFISYEQALALKELGFDEPCFGYYDGNHNLQFMYNGKPEKFTERRMGVSDSIWVGWISAPLYQQAFRWFREKYGYLSNIHDFNGNFKATLSGNCNWLGSWTKTYEEAELECLKKLIEIVKNK